MMMDINDKYRLLLRLGRGGMAEVHVAVARGPAGFNKLVVVKRLLPAMADDDGFREMFMQEARLAARLNHPNIVQTYEVGDAEDGMFLAMEYLEGQPLSRLVRTLSAADKKLAVCSCVRIAIDVLSGLQHAHDLKDFDGTALKVVHRDISPQNVFVTYLGQVKLLDFGIAKAERTSTKTQPGWLKGKYAYMAPEQFLNGEIDRRVDLFTTATVLWELVTGRPLFGGGTEAQTVKRLVTEPIPRLSTIIPAIDPQLDAIVARALERDPKDRFADAAEMKEALEEVLARLGTNEDLGRIVSGAFKETRVETEEQIARLLGDSARLSTVSLTGVPSSGSLRAMSATAPTAGASGFSQAGVAHTTATPIPEEDDGRSALGRRRLGITGIFAAGAALVLATIVVARTVSGPPAGRTNEAPSNAAAAPPPAQTAAQPSPAADSARGAPMQPSIDLIASPSAGARASATHHATASAPPAPAAPPRWSPPASTPAKPSAPATTATAASTPSVPPAPPPATTPAAPPVVHDESGGNSRRPAPTNTAPEGRRFRTTL